MLLIEAGYGAGRGPNMVLLCPSREVSILMEGIMLSYSCHPRPYLRYVNA